MVGAVVRRLLGAISERVVREGDLLEAALQSCKEAAKSLKERRLEISSRADSLAAAGDLLAEDYGRVVSMLWKAERALNDAAGAIMLLQVTAELVAGGPHSDGSDSPEGVVDHG